MARTDYPAIEKLLKVTNGSIYKLSILVAKRAFQIADGEKSLVDAKLDDKPLDVALREIKEGKIKIAKSGE